MPTPHPTQITTGPAGTEVQHHPNCLCEGEDAPGESPAIMWDERAVLRGSLEVACFAELEKRLNSIGHPVMRYSKGRRNAAGEAIGPELAVRSCEVAMAWAARGAVMEFLDELVPGSKR